MFSRALVSGKSSRSLSMLAIAAAVGAAVAPAHAQKQAEPAGRAALEMPIWLDRLETMRVVLNRTGAAGGGEGVMRGPGCPGTVASHTTANFAGGNFVLQAGFVTNEIAATTYTLPATAFPIKIDLMEFIVATTNAQVQVECRYTIMIWEGTPTTGTLIDSITATNEPAELPFAYVGPGTAGVNIQVSIDPGDPEQIFIFNNGGSNKFSIGLRIDADQTPGACASGSPQFCPGGSCLASAPTCCNAFPCTDTGGLQHPAENWLNGLNCGIFGCPPNGGWSTFQNLSQACRPTGDWVMRATWSSVNCEPDATGSCCVASGTCTVNTNAECQVSGGLWTVNGSCSPNTCPQPFGRCCLPNGTCQILEQSTCSGQQGAWTFGQNCDSPCPQPTGACCFGTSCQVLEPAVCAGFGGTFIGINVACNGGSCPLGACCLPDGSCVAGISSPACVGMNGAYQGNNSTCSPNNCPQPTGACCSSSNFCFPLTQANCLGIPGATWQGPLTICEPNPCGAVQTGACCTGSACIVTTAANCNGANSHFSGLGTTCNVQGNNVSPCCRADFNQDLNLGVPDIFAFLSAWFAGNSTANFDGEGASPTVPDIFAFLSAWFGGCG